MNADELRQVIFAELKQLDQLVQDRSAKTYRSLHRPAVEFQLKKGQEWLRRKFSHYAQYFANGEDIDPDRISPVLIEVSETWHGDLFRIARYTWSLPYTRGYGRRLRYLIVDSSNNKLIGILGLQSPPLDFPARDKLFKYPSGRKIELVNQTMDIYTLGSVPPYSRLLGGKLVALAATSDEIREAYSRKYKDRVTILKHQQLPSNIVALTTTSAFGRSSIYNRLKYHEEGVAESIGYTVGYGSFHIANIYPYICEYLREQGYDLRGGYGVGPRIVWQRSTTAFRLLGLPRDLLRHGIQREAFLFPLISNLNEYMTGEAKEPLFYNRPFASLANWWKSRWLLPRADRVDGWHQWNAEEIGRTIFLENSIND